VRLKLGLLGRLSTSKARSGNALLDQAHLGREGRVRNPASGVSGGNFFHHLIDLFEGKTFGLGYEEVGKGYGDDAQGAPHEEDLRSEIRVLLVNEIGSDDCDDAVPEPVGGGRETDSARSNWEREDLADDNPCAWSPGTGKHRDVETDKSNHC